eukprot:TRINITY_DN6107_c0_g1_i1.p1 TRINITY_DN6107_c0_g1~~TRINITY_DN6107_c0_g1_i1.p1  ORF type:complete len:177 (+),score=26.04 TRINITY_DN6107_c0_g1_i1:57-587(+)
MDRVYAAIATYPNFPKEGITFKDIHPVISDPELRKIVVKELVSRYSDKGIDIVVGLETRGYYFGIPLAFELGVPFVPFRKAGKLPGDVASVEYGLEYGKDKIQCQRGALKPGSRVLIVDDLMATGGTAAAACDLARQCGASVFEVHVLVELTKLNGRSKAPPGVPYHSFFTFDDVE